MGSGRPLDETTRSQMESIVGHDLREVRVHDSSQAGELASRLSADAFTVGANMFAAPGRLTTGTSDGVGLLGHEATHVVQQTRPQELAVDEPRRPLVPAATGRGRKAPGVLNEGGNGKAASSEGVGRSLAGGSVQRQGRSMMGEGGDEGVEEVEAQAFEQVARDTVLRAEEDEEDEVGSEVDVEKLADSLFRLMRRELLLERERR